jgi:hypothetical protein
VIEKVYDYIHDGFLHAESTEATVLFLGLVLVLGMVMGCMVQWGYKRYKSSERREYRRLEMVVE